MSRKANMMGRTGSIRMGAVFCGFCCHLFAAVPQGWYIAGSNPRDYDVAVDTSVTYSGKPSVALKPRVGQPTGFVTLLQDFRSDHYKGKRIRFSGYVKADQVEGGAGLLMRIEGGGSQVLAVDNMGDRKIKGTSYWTQYSVVLDVPEGSTGIFFGIRMEGKGTVWLSGLQLEVVYDNTPVTGITKAAEPQNLDLEVR